MIQFIAYALIAGLTLGYVKGCTDEKHRFDEYKVAVKAVGQAQEAWATALGKLNRKRKDIANAENLKLRADLTLTTDRLRVARAGSRYVPPAAPGAKRPDIAPFDRAELERAIRVFADEAAGIVEEGDKARIDLDTAKRWAQE